MANEVLVKEGTQIRFFVTGSFSPADSGTNNTVGTPTDVVLTLAGLTDDQGRQSTKVDLGATRADSYEVLGCVDFTGETPTAGATVDYYWAPSGVSTEANGNIAGNSGADGDVPAGCVPGGITLDEFLALCGIKIGSLVVTDDGAVQNGFVGVFSPPSRYGQLVVVNRSGDAFENDDVEMHQVMNPIVTEVQ